MRKRAVRRSEPRGAPGRRLRLVTEEDVPVRDASFALADHHVHIFSPAAQRRFEDGIGKTVPPLTADELLPILDRDGVRRAAVLSVAYFFARPDPARMPDRDALMSENDWVARQVARHSDRLVGFFAVNPIADDGAVEIDRCASKGDFAGVKLHLANSKVDLRDPVHVKKLSATFAQANSLGLVIVVHLRNRRDGYGRRDAEVFIDEVVSQAPDVGVQVAHSAGWGGYDPGTDDALGAFADRLSIARDAHPNLWFDVSATVRRVRDSTAVGVAAQDPAGWWPEHRYERLAKRLRSIGLERVLFGTDWPEWTPGAYASDLAENLPLDEDELRSLLANRAPWLC